MAEASEEVEQMVSMADALVLNFCTLSHRQVTSMLNAGYVRMPEGSPSFWILLVQEQKDAGRKRTITP